MIYAKVDVKLRDHVRAHKAGAAMATWLWALLYVREQETDGLVPDIAMRLAWAGEKEARRHAEALVLAGLWECHPDGWRICRYEEKNDTKATIAANRKRVRDRVAAYRRNGNGNSDRNALHDGGVTVGTAAAVPGSPSGSGSGSDLGSRSEQPDRSPTPRVWGRGPTAERALEVFADAITAVTGEPFVVGPAVFLRDDVCALMNKRAPRDTTLDVALVWLGDVTQAWMRSDPEGQDRKPSKLTDWLNAGQPNRRARRGAAEITKQPFDPDAPWMKIGDTGS